MSLGYDEVLKQRESAREYYKHYGRVGAIGVTKLGKDFALSVNFYRKDIRNVPRTFRGIPVELRFGFEDPKPQEETEVTGSAQ